MAGSTPPGSTTQLAGGVIGNTRGFDLRVSGSNPGWPAIFSINIVL